METIQEVQEELRDCAFQYAKMSEWRQTEILCDKSGLTITEAKELWNKYYQDCAKHIKSGGTAEMVIWINMHDGHTYGDTLQYISTDAESDGNRIWETTKKFFPITIQ